MACPSAQITTIVIESIHERYIVLMAMSLKIDSVHGIFSPTLFRQLPRSAWAPW